MIRYKVGDMDGGGQKVPTFSYKTNKPGGGK